MKKIFLIIACVLLTVVLFSCNGNHEHSFEETVEKAATCDDNGVLKKVCAECGHVETAEIPATNDHSFGEWQSLSAASIYRVCTVCGFSESASIPVGGESSGGDSSSIPVDGESSGGDSSSAENSTSSGSRNYASFQEFVADSHENGDTVTYAGNYNNISLSLTGGSCNNKTIVIPSTVASVEFVGLASGTPFSNVSIRFEERVTDIKAIFTDVRIESSNTMLTSASRNINVDITMRGLECSFINTGVGARGEDGIDGVTNDTDAVYGKDGGNGTPAFNIKGSVTIHVDSDALIIKGGKGGDGGAGGDIATSSAPSGGDGGNGGAAIEGEGTATVIVDSQTLITIKGGDGGAGGEGGTSKVGYFGKNRKGSNGASGASGISGCEIVYN